MFIRTFFITLASVAVTTTLSAQTASSTLRLTVDDAVNMALEHNLDLTADRLDPQISDMRVAAANGAFKPTINSSVLSNNQLQPPSSFLIPTATRTDVVTSNAGVAQHLPWFGTSYNVSWSTSHTNSNSFLTSYNPLLQSGLAINLSQPLLRDLAVDPARLLLETSRIGRDISDTRLRESVVHTAAAVKQAYWNLVAARANVDSRRSTLDLAQELMRVNKAKVDVGSMPPLDLLSAQAEVASNQEQLIIAETSVKQAEDRLRLLIFDTTQRDAWSVTLDPIDSPPIATPAVDVDAAVTRALSDRVDLVRARKEIDTVDLGVKYAANQKLPDVRLNASYQASGLGGTQVLRTGGFPGTIVGPGDAINFGSVVNQLFAHDYPTWAAGLSVSYPVGRSTDQANYARAKLERLQSATHLKSAEARAIQQIRDAAWKIEMNAKRIETARASRDLAEQRLDAEQKRFEVGMSTSFLVIQAQRDLAQAKTNELSAILAYDLSLVDFEALQEAGPSGSSGSGGPAGSGAAGGTGPTTAGSAAAPGAPRSTGVSGLSGVPQGQ